MGFFIMSTHYLLSNSVVCLVIWMQPNKPIRVRWDLLREFVLLQLLVSNTLTQLAVVVRHIVLMDAGQTTFVLHVM